MAFRPDSELWNYYNNFPEEGMAECKLCKQRIRNNRKYNLKLHINKIHKNRDAINKYFEVNVLENLAVCKTCNQKLKNRLCNLRLHMRKFHEIEIVLPEDKVVQQSPQPSDQEKITANRVRAKRKMTEEITSDAKRPANRLLIEMDKKTIIRAVIGLIVEDGVSPNLFSSKHMEAILRPICEAISKKQGKEFKVDKAEMEGILSSLANCMRNDFSNDLHCRLLSIKIDSDLNGDANTFCISAQFIKNSEIQTRVLGLIDQKNTDKLKEDHIKQILYKFNIDSNQIISAFWDNTKPQYKKQVNNSEYLKEIERLANTYPDIFLGDVKIEPYLGFIAQLCLLDIFKDSNILQAFLQCRNLVKFVSDESNGYYELFLSNNLSIPQLDSPWIVGSTCKMMNDLYEARHFLQTVKFEQLENIADQFNCNEELWLFTEAFCVSTNYLQKSILKFYNEELHFGDFYAQWLKCRILTEKLTPDKYNPNAILSALLSNTLKNIESRLNELLSKHHLLACVYLDPRFQRTLNSNQTSSAVKYLKTLWCRAKLYIGDDMQSGEEAECPLFDDDEDAFLNEFLSSDVQAKDSENNDVFQKIEHLKLAFQPVDTNVLEFWKARKISDAEMQILSSICFAIPASQVYNKEHYSHVYRLEAHSNLSPFTKENLLHLRMNANLLDDTFKCLRPTNDEESNASSCPSETEVDITEDDDSNTASTTTTFGGPEMNSSVDKIAASNTKISSDELPSEEFI